MGLGRVKKIKNDCGALTAMKESARAHLSSWYLMLEFKW